MERHALSLSWVRRSFDIVVVTGFTVAAFLLRRGGLPTDGLWFDDAWVATGALHARLSDAVVAGSAHPGFTAWLRFQHDVLGGGLRSLAFPALLAGCLGPALLYLMLRQFTFARSISLLLASALLVSDLHVRYSGRVKSYTIDVVVVALLLILVPRLADRRWTWAGAGCWAAGAVFVGTFSGYCTVATAVAIGILVLHPMGDRLVRIAALALQGAFQVGLYVSASTVTNLAAIERFMEQPYDGHMTFHANPILFAKESMTHVARVADVYPGGRLWVLPVLGLSAILGLLVGSIVPRSRRLALAARLGLALVALAFAASMVDRFPFGPTTRDFLGKAGSPGGRHTLWMVPILALGLAILADRGWQAMAPWRRGRMALDVGLVALSGLTVFAGWSPAPAYLFPGGETAARLVDARVDSVDLVLVLDEKVYVYATSTQEPFTLARTPDHMVGFTPDFADDRIVGIGSWARRTQDPDSVRELIRGKDSVLVYGGLVGPTSDRHVRPVLEQEGFHDRTLLWLKQELVTLWTR